MCIFDIKALLHLLFKKYELPHMYRSSCLVTPSWNAAYNNLVVASPGSSSFQECVDTLWRVMQVTEFIPIELQRRVHSCICDDLISTCSLVCRCAYVTPPAFLLIYLLGSSDVVDRRVGELDEQFTKVWCRFYQRPLSLFLSDTIVSSDFIKTGCDDKCKATF